MQSLDPQQGVIFGVHPVEQLVESRPAEVERVYFQSGRQEGALFGLLKECRRQRLPYQVVPLRRLEELAGKVAHQGVVAQCAVKSYASIESVLEALDAAAEPALVLVPASVEDVGNLGSLIRSAVAFGVHAVLLERGNTAPLSPAVAKTSAGMLEHMTVCRPRSLEAAVGQLKQRGCRVVGAEAGAERLPEEVDLRQSTVLVLGGEHRGIPPYLRKLCDEVTGIPIALRAGSLNVSVAAGVLLYECRRQRTTCRT